MILDSKMKKRIYKINWLNCMGHVVDDSIINGADLQGFKDKLPFYIDDEKVMGFNWTELDEENMPECGTHFGK